MKRYFGSIRKYQVTIFLAFFSMLAVAVTYRTVGTIRSYNWDTEATNVPIFYPRTVVEARSLIREAYQRNVSVRFSGASHSTSPVILGKGIYIKSDYFNHINGIESHPKYGHVVSVESGVKLGDLSNYLAQKGFTLGFAYPFYHGVSMGGLVSTGSHGTSRKHLAQSSQNILEMTLINGLGNLVTINTQTPQALRAARVSLGLLGFIYKMKLKIYPDFNIQFRSTPYVDQTALLQKNGHVNWGPVADTEYFYWFPYDNRALKVEGHIVNKPAHPGAESIVLGEVSEDTPAVRATAKILIQGKNDIEINKKVEAARSNAILAAPPPYVRIENNKYVRAQDVVGKSSKMLLSRHLPINPVYTAQDISFSFRIQDAPRVLSQIHEFSRKNNFHVPYAGIFMRFAAAQSASYLSHIERPGVARDLYVMAEFFELKYYTNAVAPSVSSRMRQQLLQLLVSQNLISFHWGKNVNEIFSFQANKKLLGSNVAAFEKVRRQMDPKGLFVNQFAQNYILK